MSQNARAGNAGDAGVSDVQPIRAQLWMDRIDAVASSKVGIEGWRAWIYTKADQGGLFVTGAVCPPISRGHRKGHPNVQKHDPATKCVVYLTAEECT